jgi:hypothetical protein
MVAVSLEACRTLSSGLSSCVEDCSMLIEDAFGYWRVEGQHGGFI